MIVQGHCDRCMDETWGVMRGSHPQQKHLRVAGLDACSLSLLSLSLSVLSIVSAASFFASICHISVQHVFLPESRFEILKKAYRAQHLIDNAHGSVC